MYMNVDITTVCCALETVKKSWFLLKSITFNFYKQ